MLLRQTFFVEAPFEAHVDHDGIPANVPLRGTALRFTPAVGDRLEAAVTRVRSTAEAYGAGTGRTDNDPEVPHPRYHFADDILPVGASSSGMLTEQMLPGTGR